MKKTKLLALLLALAMYIGLFAACGSSSSETDTASDTSAAEETSTEESEAAAPASEAAAAEEAPATDAEEVPAEEAPAEDTAAEEAEDEWVYTPIEYPLDAGDLELELWVIMDLSPSSALSDWNEHPMLPLIKEWTGVGMYINAQPQSNGTEKTNLMIASQDYPDMIGGFTYTTGISAAIDDEVILQLNDYIPTYAPDYYQLLLENDGENLKGVATDDGEIGVFASVSNGSRGPSDGLMVRQDYLDALGLEVPTTFDEATEVLTALSVAYGLTDPLYMTGDGILDSDQLVGSYGIALKFDSITGEGGFYVDENGDVQFGYVQEGYVDYVTQIKEWYDAGLIGTDFISNPTDYKNEDLIEKVMAGYTAIFSRGDGLIDMFIAVTGADIQAIPDFTVNEGDTIHLGNPDVVAFGTSGLVVTTGCEEPELAMQFINWWYTDEGFLASNYGIEDVSYYIDDNGDPQYTEMMTSDPNNTLSSMKLDYCGIITVRTDGLTPEASYSEVAQNAPLVWGSNKDGLYEIPDGITMTIDEGDAYGKIFSDVSTYCQEMTCKLITGAVDMSEIYAFQETLEGMGVQEMCDIYQAALDRYNSR